MSKAYRRFLHVLLAGCILLACLGLTASAAPADALDLARFRGKVIVVDFWASWCAPCRHSFPWLNELQAKYAAQGLVIVGVNVDRDRAAAERFLRETPARFDIVYDPKGELAAKYEAPGMPASYIFGRDGELAARHVGFRKAARAQREREIQSILARAQARAQ